MSALPIPLHRPTEAEQVVDAVLDAIEDARAALSRLPDSSERHLVEVELDRILGLLASGAPDDL
jgi:hypothetical protein